MEKITIYSPNKRHQATIIPELGAVLSSLLLNRKEVIQFPLKGANSWKDGFPSSLLFPFPNRINKGSYVYEGNTYQLEINEKSKGHAIHGLITEKSFTVVNQSDTQLVLSLALDGSEIGYPFVCDITLTYILTNDGLELLFKVFNRDDRSIPVAFGWHPYFRLGESAIDTYTIEMPKCQQISVNELHIPVGRVEATERKIKSLQGVSLDTAFELKEQGWVSTKLMNDKDILTVSQWVDTPEGLHYIVVYTPETRDCIAIEPQTANIDAFNNEEGLRIVAPLTYMESKIKVALDVIGEAIEEK